MACRALAVLLGFGAGFLGVSWEAIACFPMPPPYAIKSENGRFKLVLDRSDRPDRQGRRGEAQWRLRLQRDDAGQWGEVWTRPFGEPGTRFNVLIAEDGRHVALFDSSPEGGSILLLDEKGAEIGRWSLTDLYGKRVEWLMAQTSCGFEWRGETRFTGTAPTLEVEVVLQTKTGLIRPKIRIDAATGQVQYENPLVWPTIPQLIAAWTKAENSRDKHWNLHMLLGESQLPEAKGNPELRRFWKARLTDPKTTEDQLGTVENGLAAVATDEELAAAAEAPIRSERITRWFLSDLEHRRKDLAADVAVRILRRGGFSSELRQVLLKLAARSPKGAPHLEQALSDPNPEVRIAAVWSHEALPPTAERLRVLLAKLPDQDPRVNELLRRVIFSYLEKSDNPQLVRETLPAIARRDPWGGWTMLLGGIAEADERLDEAERLYREALVDFDREGGPWHRHNGSLVAETLIRLAIVTKAAGRPEESTAYGQRLKDDKELSMAAVCAPGVRAVLQPKTEVRACEPGEAGIMKGLGAPLRCSPTAKRRRVCSSQAAHAVLSDFVERESFCSLAVCPQ